MTKRRSRPAPRGPGTKLGRPAPRRGLSGALAGPQDGAAAQPRREAELRKQRLEELREKQRAARGREKGLRRSLEDLQREALQRQREHEQRERDLRALEQHQHPQLEREASRKAYYREFRKVVDAADVVLEVLDARDPQSCRCPQVEQAVLQAGGSKKLVLVLNKIDLVPKELVLKWLAYLRNEFPTVAFKASTQQQNRHLQQSKVSARQASAELLGTGACVGADCLMKVLGNYCRSQDLRTSIRVGVVGFPNVGKSSLINSLKRARACSVGATPGVTKCLQEVHLDKHVTLLDSPGIVLSASTSDTALILRNCLKIEQLADPVTPVEAILRRCSHAQLSQHYGIPDFKTTTEFLVLLARRLGRLKKGGAPDQEKAAKAVLTDWMNGKISYFTHPPETHKLPTHISAEIVSEMGKAFDFEALEQGNMEALASMPQGPVVFGQKPFSLTSETEEEMLEEEEEFWDAREDLEDFMDEDKDPEFGALTVQLKGSKSKKPAEAEQKLPQAPRLEEIWALDPLHQGQGLAAACKRRKKLQKRADKLATKLSDSLVAALDLTITDA
ncbi:guanine nucleotide-binding protein-like 3-like protein [Phascolarctos cinereus]|uniref:Guanine nucleotide-binding protein-like 3-like protein n=1 Tax=Phascolarctos cinereus TaxID=38626 RepID=A0A6P5J2G4_PHACI|nr:guanine nucleotide-binding protein-like 3-like protein [Phascolarctos cinereus]